MRTFLCVIIFLLTGAFSQAQATGYYLSDAKNLVREIIKTKCISLQNKDGRAFEKIEDDIKNDIKHPLNKEEYAVAKEAANHFCQPQDKKNLLNFLKRLKQKP